MKLIPAKLNMKCLQNFPFFLQGDLMLILRRIPELLQIDISQCHHEGSVQHLIRDAVRRLVDVNRANHIEIMRDLQFLWYIRNMALRMQTYGLSRFDRA
ncbi:hypothetical protein D3C81_1182420 [compost metagenome]